MPRGDPRQVVVPLASALVAHRDRYFDLLSAYRDGDPGAIITAFAAATGIAARESLVTARRLAEIPIRWQSMTAPVRGDSAAADLLPRLLDNPILTTEDARLLLGASPSATYSAIARLHDAGVLRPLTNRKRDQVWGAGLVLDEIEDLGVRIGSAAR
jgi:hypothetical protein